MELVYTCQVRVCVCVCVKVWQRCQSEQNVASKCETFKSLRILVIRSLSLSSTCLGHSFFSRLWDGGCGVGEEKKPLYVAQHLLEVRRGSISVNVIWHSTQRQLHGADDSAKPCLWRLHAWRCWAVIWSSHAKADRQAALSQPVRQSGSRGFHRGDETSISVKSVQ